MKFIRLFVLASAGFFVACAALAQTSGTVTKNAFVIGKGAGQQGYTSLLCGSAQLAVGQTAADPICRTLTGDVTLSAAGVTTIGADKVLVSMIADAELKALAGLISAADKCPYFTGSGAATVMDCLSWSRSVTSAATVAAGRTAFGLAIGTDVQAYDTDLSALAGNSTNGIWARTGSGTGSARTITGTTNQITVTNGDGVSGNPTISIPSNAALPGAPTTTTASPSDNSTKIATTAYVDAQVAGGVAGVASIDAKTGTFTTANGIESTGGNVIQLTAARRTLPTIQRFLSGSGTYTTPANVQFIRVRMVGGGAGGAGTGSGSGSGGNGGASCWNTSGAACTTPVLSAGGGAGGTSSGGAGGVITGSGTCNLVAVSGGGGGGAGNSGTVASASGGNSFLGGGAGGAIYGGSAGNAGATNTGGGGSGSTNSTFAAGSGGAGAYCETIITSPAGSYTYAVGAAGAAGTAGSGGSAGGAGGSGMVVVEEYYNS